MRLLTATLLSLSMIASSAAQDSQAISIARSGSQPPRQGLDGNFTGPVRVDPLFPARETTRTSGSYVTFQPGARTLWHTHPRGQTLVITAGVGRVQHWGGPAEEIRAGDVVWIPPGVKHWHGAAPGSAMTHIAITEHLDGKVVDWMEKVSDEQYSAAGSGLAGAGPMQGQPTVAQKLFGDVAPKLAELTDNVLFGDVWERPGLSKRDRSLATVSALIALNRPDQLRSHLRRALDNGVRKEELIETITHLAFHSCWPNAINAALVAKEVLQ